MAELYQDMLRKLKDTGADFFSETAAEDQERTG